MLFHWCQHTQIALHPPSVIVADIVFYHPNELLLTVEAPSVITLPFQYLPEAFHQAAVYATRHTRYTLRHSSLNEFLAKCTACALVFSVAVKQRMRIRARPNSTVKHFEYKKIIISFTIVVEDNTLVTEIPNALR